ncbi:hypothetical protein MIMGU_mgv11b018749mg, partial [Erythranthe guttata]
MEASTNNSTAPFLVKTYEMVDDPLTNSVVSWNYTGNSFVVWNPPEFAADLLPKKPKISNPEVGLLDLNSLLMKIPMKFWSTGSRRCGGGIKVDGGGEW